MQFGFFRIPLATPEPHADELNRFLRTHRILSVQREMVQENGCAYWALCVEYLPASGGGGPPNAAGAGGARAKVDYREVLSQEDFAVFSRLRQLRKEVAERDALPVYAVFSNEQLAAMVTGKMDSLAAIKTIEGVGDSRIEKYGAAFLAVLKHPKGGSDETDRKPAP